MGVERIAKIAKIANIAKIRSSGQVAAFMTSGHRGYLLDGLVLSSITRRVAAQLLSSYLLIWVPGTFALELLSALPSMGMRGGLAWVELALHGAAAALCGTAGRMIRVASPAAFRFAVMGILGRTACSIQSLLSTLLPRDVAPGTRGFLIALACANAAVWLAVAAWTCRRHTRM